MTDIEGKKKPSNQPTCQLSGFESANFGLIYATTPHLFAEEVEERRGQQELLVKRKELRTTNFRNFSTCINCITIRFLGHSILTNAHSRYLGSGPEATPIEDPPMGNLAQM